MRRLKIFGDDLEEAEGNEEHYMEVNVMDTDDKKTGRVRITIEKLNDFRDTDAVLRALRKGNIVFLKIKGLKERNMQLSDTLADYKGKANEYLSMIIKKNTNREVIVIKC